MLPNFLGRDLFSFYRRGVNYLKIKRFGGYPNSKNAGSLNPHINIAKPNYAVKGVSAATRFGCYSNRVRQVFPKADAIARLIFR